MAPETYRYHFNGIIHPEEIHRLLQTPSPDINRQNLLKMLVGWEIANRVEDGQKIALGSGTTSEAAIRAIGARHLRVAGIATSRKLAVLAETLGIAVENFDITLARIRNSSPITKDIVWGFDGADEVEAVRDDHGKIVRYRIIKGGGGAHTIERANALRCVQWVCIVDESKIVPSIGAFPVAVEVVPSEEASVRQAMSVYKPLSITQKPDFTTDLGNMILNVHMGAGNIQDSWETQWRQIPGVIDTGLFINEVRPSEILVSYADGTVAPLQ